MPTQTPTVRFVPDRARRDLPDVAEQRRHAQRAEDEADEPAEHADGGAREDRGADVEVLAARIRSERGARFALAQQIDAEVHEHRADGDEQRGIGQADRTGSRPTTAPTIDGGAIQANSRQLMRPARTCTIAAASAATPEMPMLAPAPAAGWDATSSTAGRRIFPSTRPTTPPASATAKHHAQKAISSSGSTRRASLPGTK